MSKKITCFKAYDARGKVPSELNTDIAYRVGRAYAAFIKPKQVAIGRDARLTSDDLFEALSNGLRDSGVDVLDLGLCGTEAVYFAAFHLQLDGGIMITASHNPPEYNGIKLVASDGVEVSREDENVIEEIFFKKNWKQNSSTWGSTKSDDRSVQTYLDGIKSQVNVSKIKSKNLKVVLDLGNGVQSVTAIKLCEQLGCEVIAINQEIDGSFPGRGSEPTPNNLQELSSTVVNNNANLGIAFDSDGDRSIFCDDRGMLLSGDKSALLISDYLLKKDPNSTAQALVQRLTRKSKHFTLTDIENMRKEEAFKNMPNYAGYI